MTSDQWQPLSRREAALPADETVYDGVPPHLEMALREWVERVVPTDAFGYRVVAALRLDPRPNKGGSRVAHKLAEVPVDRLLDVVDCMIRLDVAEAALDEYERARPQSPLLAALGPRRPSFEDPVAELDALLGDAGSAYQVREADDDAPAGLERVVEPTVADAFDAAVRTAEDSGRVTAGACLRSAWAKAYTLRPDPNGAYSDAVRAVEDVALPLFARSRPDPTLGDVIREFRDNADAYELELLSAYAVPATITTVTDMLKLLWHGHRDRHPGGATSAPVTEKAAQGATHLAALLVHWFATGIVRHKP